MIWRERRILLIVLAVLLAANAVFFLTYRVQFKSRVDSLDERLAERETQLQQARTARLRTDRTVHAYRQIERDARQVFEEHWSTQPKRFTLLIGEVKRLAAASNMTPPRYGFDRDTVNSDAAPGKRRIGNIGATEVGIGFTVSGTYEQIRRLINLLELSRQFVIIDQISLSKSEGQTLTLNLRLKTLFRDEPVPAALDGRAPVANDRL